MRPKRKKYVLVRRQPAVHSHLHLRNGWVNGLSICGVVVAIVGILSIFVVFFFVLLQPCTHDSQCMSDNPCTVDTCEANFCKHTSLRDCCNSDVDCRETPCHETFCNVNLNLCTARQKQNGTACNDKNSCTVNDRCLGGLCVGNMLTCDLNQCLNGECHKDRGCIYTKKEDDTPCSDNNLCTVGDKCFRGMCTSGIPKMCGHLDNQCNTGVCDAGTGGCIEMPRENGLMCSNDAICEENSVCTDGICVGGEKMCFDNNPCTVDKCVPDIGCMIQYNFTNGMCAPGCTSDEHCPTSFICHDGTCLNVPISEKHITVRFIDYELVSCSTIYEQGHRLVMSFVMDAEADMLGNDKYYRIVHEKTDITTSTPQPLGFINEVLTLDTNIISADMSRSAFSMQTACQIVTENNCNTIFADKTYKFDLKIAHCMNITAEPYQNCIDPNMHVQASVMVSVSDCNPLAVRQTIIVYGKGVLYFENTKYVGTNESNVAVIGIHYGNSYANKRIIAGIETDVYNNSNFIAMLHSVRLCVVNPHHRYSHCVTDESDPNCPYHGCYWSFDNPLSLTYDLMEYGHMTAMAESDQFDAFACYGDNDYLSEDKCELEKCSTKRWPYAMDDGISFTLKWIEAHVGTVSGQKIVVDMVYRITGCLPTLQAAHEELHKVTAIKIPTL